MVYRICISVSIRNLYLQRLSNKKDRPVLDIGRERNYCGQPASRLASKDSLSQKSELGDWCRCGDTERGGRDCRVGSGVMDGVALGVDEIVGTAGVIAAGPDLRIGNHMYAINPSPITTCIAQCHHCACQRRIV